MEHGPSVVSLAIVVLAALLTPILISRLKVSFLPVVVAEIIVGVIIGRSFLNIVDASDPWLNILSTLGFIFLMFLSGLEIDFDAFTQKSTGQKKSKVLKRPLPNTLLLTTGIFLGILTLSLLFALMMRGFGVFDDIFLLVIIISTISLGVVVPTLKEANLITTQMGQIILLVAVIADLATMIMLAFYSQLYADASQPIWLMTILVGFAILFYLLGRVMNQSHFIKQLNNGTMQIGIRGVFALIIMLVALAEGVGAENILGAFIAGCIVSLLKPDQDIVHKLDSFGYGFFIPIFFIMVGVDLDLPSLFSDSRVFILIPVLLLAFLLSKLVPVLVLLRYFDAKRVTAAGFLLTSTLSLIIAAAVIAEQIGMITNAESGMFILSAVIACIITPAIFRQLYPEGENEDRVINVTVFGNNQLTVPVAHSIAGGLYHVKLVFHKNYSDSRERSTDNLSFHEIPEYSEEALDEIEAFDADIVVLGANDSDINWRVAEMADKKGVERIIYRVDDPTQESAVKERGYELFSTMLSSKTLLRGLIESPNMMQLLSDEDTAIYEIQMNNYRYDEMLLRNFPFTGDIIFLRILRGQESLVPHGDTPLHVDDRIFMTGSREYVEELKRELELY
ncbi:cation:proton antiporter [Salinicoccus roseus]|uniref:cation:proton antiporter domain-containing protein n=1 Tax=Salinicoccus roseus TaxID=45670 RepID=UPI00356543F7